MMSGGTQGADAATPSSKLTDDALTLIFDRLDVPDIGAAGAVSRRWHSVQSPSFWKNTATRFGFDWNHAPGISAQEAARRNPRGWKGYVRRERRLERSWLEPGGAALQARIIESGHHWVPSILMEEATREMVTCSYDGTVRFWTDVEDTRPGMPSCFKVLTGGFSEGFSCIDALHAAPGAELGSGPVLLAAGSELGNVHVWEAWRPQDRKDALAVRVRAAYAAEHAPSAAAFTSNASAAEAAVESGGGGGSSSSSSSSSTWGAPPENGLAGNLLGAAQGPEAAAHELEPEGGHDEDEDDGSGSEDIPWHEAEMLVAGLHADIGGGHHGAADAGAAAPPQQPHPQQPPPGPGLSSAAAPPPAGPQARRPHFERKVAEWRGCHDFVQSILLMPGGVVVSGGDSGRVVVNRLDPAGRAPPAADGAGERGATTTLGHHQGAVMCLDAQRLEGGGGGGVASHAPSSVFSGSVDHTVAKWDLGAGGVPSACFTGHTRSVHCLALADATPHGPNVLFTGSRDHTIKLWDLRTRECEHTLVGHTGSVTCMGARGWRLVSGGGYNRGADDDEVLSVDSSLRLWDMRKLNSTSDGRAARPGGARTGSGGANGGTGGSTKEPSDALVWTREAPSPKYTPPGLFQDPTHHHRGDPVLSLQLFDQRVLTSHGGHQWTARIWDLLPPRPRGGG